MRRQIKLTTRQDLTAAISQRYQAADRNGKKLILDEFVKLTSYHRKHAIRLLATEGRTHQGRRVGATSGNAARDPGINRLFGVVGRTCRRAGLWTHAHAAERDAALCGPDCRSAVQLLTGQSS